jgi:hypothetical protein
VLLDRGVCPWTFLAFPRELVNAQGKPAESDVQAYIASVQSQGVPVVIWVDTPTENTAYAFVDPDHKSALQAALDVLQQSGRYPEGYAEDLVNRLFAGFEQARKNERQTANTGH